MLNPPDSVRGITELDKTLFKKKLGIPFLSIKGLKISTILPVVKPYMLKLEHLKPIEIVSDKEFNILLNPEKVQDWSNFPKNVQNSLINLSVDKNDFMKKVITLNYENYSAEDIFRAVLPKETEGMSSFTKVGHIVQVNLREHLLPFKKLIGEVLYDKVSQCTSVVNKTNMIDNTYRNFSMEILKGDTNMLTTVKENKCTFKLDFSTVYWNSRLCTEHERIVKQLKPNDVLFDVFAGVGPFSVPAAKKKCYVFSNDLNPHSFKWLVHNFKSNKVDDKYFKAYNKDGSDFIRDEIKNYLPRYLKSNINVYITMNLPAMAAQFIDLFVGLLTNDEVPDCFNPPTVFIYCFSKGEDSVKIAKNLIVSNSKFNVSDMITEIFSVRKVSSLKEMMRVTLRLEKEILTGDVGKRKLEDGQENFHKKICVGSELLQCGDMGKYKKNNIFKVAGARSLKVKDKAKIIKNKLKHINIKNKCMEIDKTLLQLEEKVRNPNTSDEKATGNFTKSTLPTIYTAEALESQKKSEETLQNFDKINI